MRVHELAVWLLLHFGLCAQTIVVLQWEGSKVILEISYFIAFSTYAFLLIEQRKNVRKRTAVADHSHKQ